MTTKVTEMAPIMPRSNARILVSDEALIEAMAQILHGAGGMKLSEAIKKAQNMGLDLVEVAPTANPPVCKIVDFGQ